MSNSPIYGTEGIDFITAPDNTGWTMYGLGGNDYITGGGGTTFSMADRAAMPFPAVRVLMF